MAFDETQQCLGHELKGQNEAPSETHNEIFQKATLTEGGPRTGSLAKKINVTCMKQILCCSVDRKTKKPDD